MARELELSEVSFMHMTDSWHSWGHWPEHPDIDSPCSCLSFLTAWCLGYNNKCPVRTRKTLYLLVWSGLRGHIVSLRPPLQACANSKGDNRDSTSQKGRVSKSQRGHLQKMQPATSVLYEQGSTPCHVSALHVFPVACALVRLLHHILQNVWLAKYLTSYILKGDPNFPFP